MIIKNIKVDFEDDRGIIMDIVSKIDFQHATIITSKAHAIRGDHYHKFTSQYTFVLSGSFKYLSKKHDSSEVENYMLKKNDLVFSPPEEDHLLYAIEDSTMLVLTRGIRGGEDYEKDTYRLDEKQSLKKYINEK